MYSNPSGTFSYIEGQANCDVCEAGHYSPTGASECTVCAAGNTPRENLAPASIAPWGHTVPTKGLMSAIFAMALK